MMLNKTRIARLEHLLEVIRATPRKKWDMSYWGKQTACGTVCCALGNAALDPKFKKAGLKGVWLEQIEWDEDHNREITVHNLQISYKGNDSVYAGADFFGLTMDEAWELFASDGQERDLYNGKELEDITRGDVIRAIKKLIKRYKEA